MARSAASAARRETRFLGLPLRGWRMMSLMERTPTRWPRLSTTGRRRTCLRAIASSASRTSSTGVQVWTSPVNNSATRTSAARCPRIERAMQMSRSVTTPTTRPSSSTMGTTPQSRRHMTAAASASVESGRQTSTSRVIKLSTSILLSVLLRNLRRRPRARAEFQKPGHSVRSLLSQLRRAANAGGLLRGLWLCCNRRPAGVVVRGARFLTNREEDGLGAARTFVVGDIHGCYDELLALVELVGLGERDRLVCVGDLVVKGEKSREVLELFMSDARFSSVLGNHDRALLQAWKGEREDLKPSQQRCRARRGAGLERYAAVLASLPLFIVLGTRVVVHAGLRPNVALAEQSAEDLTELRTLGPDRTSREGTPWYEVYRGERVALFGHWPMTPPRRGPRAIGLDTGCVYGYSLTAYVVETGEFFSVPARRAYEAPRGRVENENG